MPEIVVDDSNEVASIDDATADTIARDVIVALRLESEALRLYQRGPLPRLSQWAAGHGLVPRRLAVMEQMAPRLSDRFFDIPPTEREFITISRL